MSTLPSPTRAAADKKPKSAIHNPQSALPTSTFVGSDNCIECHKEENTQLGAQEHGKAMIAVEAKGKGHLCEGCHGPGSVHANDPSAETAAEMMKTARSGAGCLSCHNTHISSTKWRMSAHQKNNVGCTMCHAMPENVNSNRVETHGTPALAACPTQPQPHKIFNRKPSTEICLSCHQEMRGQLSMPSHHPLNHPVNEVEKGVMNCASCHDVHTPMDNKIKSDVCTTCHIKQHGPYIYEHDKVGGFSDGCLDCHRPHGSPNRSLLVMSGRGLCLQCHGDRAMHFIGRDCLSCHTAVHGSNTNKLLMTE